MGANGQNYPLSGANCGFKQRGKFWLQGSGVEGQAPWTAWAEILPVDSSRDVDFVGNSQVTSKSLKVVVGDGETWGLVQKLMKAHPGSRVGF